MSTHKLTSLKKYSLVLIISGILSFNVNGNVPILQPGAPGNPTIELDAETAIAIADSSYTAADVEFLQGMIIHHYQACLLYTSTSPRDRQKSRMPSSA